MFKNQKKNLLLPLKGKIPNFFITLPLLTIISKQLDRMVDRVKPWFMVHGLAYGSWFMVSLIKFFLNMVDYTVFFPVLSTLTWVTLPTLRSTWGFYLNHLIPLRPFKSVFDNVLQCVRWQKDEGMMLLTGLF